MAWRIDENVVRGEIDNRTRGRVIGRLWLAGHDKPIELDLAGNAWRDVAGRRLEFVNPKPLPVPLENFGGRQTGVIGDCTASRKVKVPEIPIEQVMEHCAAGKPWPWHWANSLYLEWFSTPNGRVVVESASFELTIGDEIAWEMTAEEEKAQRLANAEAMGNFLGRIADVAGSPATPAPGAAESADSGNEIPVAEQEAEKLQQESDRLSDRINARLAREGEEHYDRILDEELERRRIERGESPPTAEEEAERAEWIEEMNREADEALANPDSGMMAEVRRKHPLYERASQFAFSLRKESEGREWIPPDAMDEHPVVDMVGSVMSATAKLAGALNGSRWPPDNIFCGSVIVRLKRARGCLDHALLAAEFCDQEKLVDADWLAGVQREMNALGRECDILIGELRANLSRGFE